MEPSTHPVFQTSKDRLVVFYVKLGDLWLDDYKFETALRLLPFHYQTRIISKKFSKDAHTALANQLLQRYICSILTHTPSNALRFTTNEYGKPRLRGSDISFSMSNQRGYTAMVVSQEGADLGIDLASTDDIDRFGDENYLDHFRDIFHPKEFEYLQTIEDKDTLKNIFTHFWALKEAYTKKLGVGLNGDLNAYLFSNVDALPVHSSASTLENFSETNIEWNQSVSLKVYDTAEPVQIFSTMIDAQVALSVCRDGESKSQPLLIEVPIESMVAYFQDK